MSLLTVVQDVCAVVGVAVPTSVFTNITNNRTMQEILQVANEMAQRIAYDTRDWTALRVINDTSIVGDGVKTSFPVPADFKRLLLTANVWRSTNNVTPMRFIPDTEEWMKRRAQNIYDAYGEWTMLGSNMLIQPTLQVGQSCYYTYLHKNPVALQTGGLSDRFLNDADGFVLDERTLKLGMIWQWKAQKGAPYQEDLGTYGDALSNAMGHDSPAPILVGGLTLSVAAKTAYPFPVPTPGGP